MPGEIAERSTYMYWENSRLYGDDHSLKGYVEHIGFANGYIFVPVSGYIPGLCWRATETEAREALEYHAETGAYSKGA